MAGIRAAVRRRATVCRSRGSFAVRGAGVAVGHVIRVVAQHASGPFRAETWLRSGLAVESASNVDAAHDGRLRGGADGGWMPW